MARWPNSAVSITRPICVAACLALTAAASGPVVAQSKRPALPENARTALDAIEPIPEFPEKKGNATLVRPDELSNTERRAWRDAESRFADGRWQDAAEKLKPLIDQHAGFAEGCVLRARCRARMGNAQKAAADLAAAIAVDPLNIAAHELAGETALLAGDKATAIYEFRLAIMADPVDATSADRALATLFLARTLEAEGYLSAAADLYSQFLDVTSDMSPEMRRNDRLREMVETTPPELRRRIAAIRARLGDETQAADAWQRIVKERGDDAKAWRELAQAQAKGGDADAAFKSLTRYLELARLGAGALVELDALCDLMPSVADCEARSERVIRKLDDADLSIFWVRQQIKADHVKKATPMLEAAAASHPERADLRFLLAELRAKTADMPAAYEELVAGCRVSADPTAQVLEMLRTEKSIDLSSLIDEGKAHVASHPDDAMSRLVYATLLIANKQPEAAIKQLLQDQGEAQRSGAAWTALGEAYINQLKWGAAQDAVKKAIAVGAKSQHVYYLKGVVHDALNEDAKAIEAYEKAGQLDPTKTDAFMGLAGLAERNGDRRTAENVYRQILSDVDPDCAAAMERLIVYYMNTAQFKEAQRLFAEFQKRHPDSPAFVRCSAMIDLLSADDKSADDRLETYLGTLRSILKTHPDNAQTYIELAKTYIAVNRLDEALTELRSAVRVDPKSIKALELEADVDAKLLNFADAETVIDRLLKFRPRDVRYLQSKLDYASSRGDSDKTIDMLRELVGRDDLSAYRDRFTLQLVQELRGADRFDEAVDASKRWLEAKPNDYLRRNLYLENLTLAGRHDEAIALARQYHEAAPNDRLAQIQLLANLQGAHRSPEAIRLAMKWLAANPSDFDLTAAIVRLCWSTHQWDDAIEICKSAIDGGDDRPQYERLLGQTLLHAKRYDELIDLRREQVRIRQLLMDNAEGTPNEAQFAYDVHQANYQLINAMVEAGRFEAAERLALSLLSPRLASDQRRDQLYIVDLQNIMSEIYRRSGQKAKAIESLEAIYKRMPQDGGANNNLAYTLADAGQQIERAEKLVRYALSQNPSSSANLDTLGWVLYKEERFKEAVYYLRRALREANFDDPVIFDHLADALYRMDDTAGAKHAWEKALSYCDPTDDPPPRTERVELYGTVKAKLDALNGGERVETAPLAKNTGARLKPSVQGANAE